MSSEDSFLSFPIWMPFISFSCVTTLARTRSATLNRNREQTPSSVDLPASPLDARVPWCMHLFTSLWPKSVWGGVGAWRGHGQQDTCEGSGRSSFAICFLTNSVLLPRLQKERKYEDRNLLQGFVWIVQLKVLPPSPPRLARGVLRGSDLQETLLCRVEVVSEASCSGAGGSA